MYLQVLLRSNTVCRDLHHFNIPRHITLGHYIDSIIGAKEKEVTHTLIALVRHTPTRKWEVNPTKHSGPANSVKFLD